MCQINRRPLLTSLLAIPAPPTSIILDRPRPSSLPSSAAISLQTSRSLAGVSHSWDKSPARSLSTKGGGESRERGIAKGKVTHNTPHCKHVIRRVAGDSRAFASREENGQSRLSQRISHAYSADASYGRRKRQEYTFWFILEIFPSETSLSLSLSRRPFSFCTLWMQIYTTIYPSGWLEESARERTFRRGFYFLRRDFARGIIQP